ncbi:MAG: hypothetical protein SV598_07150 [Pseudomonadota bacterium]|nr:hypothetical protein [Pseudomonadota bacterium]
MKNGILESKNFSHLLALARGARAGNMGASENLARQLRNASNAKAVLRQLKQQLHQDEIEREKLALQRRAERERKQHARFPPTHPLFRKSRATGGRKNHDAMKRAVLCGGFETNRTRH